MSTPNGTFDPIGAAALGHAANQLVELGSKFIEARYLPAVEVRGEVAAEKQRRRLERLARMAESRGPRRAPFAERVSAVAVGAVTDTDSPYVAGYVAGILASAEAEVPDDDDGVTAMRVVEQMSTLSIAAHYVLYSTIRTLSAGVDLTDFIRRVYFVPFQEMAVALRMESNGNRVRASLTALERLGLIQDVGWAPGNKLRGLGASATVLAKETSYIVFKPTLGGLNLFIDGLGAGQAGTAPYFREATSYRPYEDWEIPSLIADSEHSVR